ncbi:uncharacterized protein A4U43_C07F29900 [Asparagus officinalis]|uniref:Uncharacterized protein n=1 Tax=Asparagus officinalis TaxID=4686 RepID=A0A5P1EFW0_ASPOF|nr:uncharacterized protein A4U43_C07F29900 [Asparagus officinalis]
MSSWRQASTKFVAKLGLGNFLSRTEASRKKISPRVIVKQRVACESSLILGIKHLMLHMCRLRLHSSKLVGFQLHKLLKLLHLKFFVVGVDSPHLVAEHEAIGGDITVLELTGIEALIEMEANVEALAESRDSLGTSRRLGKSRSLRSRLLEKRIWSLRSTQKPQVLYDVTLLSGAPYVGLHQALRSHLTQRTLLEFELFHRLKWSQDLFYKLWEELEVHKETLEVKGGLGILEKDEEADGGLDEVVGKGSSDVVNSSSSFNKPTSPPPDSPSSSLASIPALSSAPNVPSAVSCLLFLCFDFEMSLNKSMTIET